MFTIGFPPRSLFTPNKYVVKIFPTKLSSDEIPEFITEFQELLKHVSDYDSVVKLTALVITDGPWGSATRVKYTGESTDAAPPPPPPPDHANLRINILWPPATYFGHEIFK